MYPTTMHNADDAERLETARELMQWAGYYLAHVSATPTTHRTRAWS